ncbi:MAG TPA: glycosyltransferase family 9 protein [Candidatus Methylomirabilis sp.]|nr:glycosyltransferase family 9 protein [Candidatus Methylomirabilis sp.]
MKVPWLDGLVRWTTLGAHACGLFSTATGWLPEELRRARGILVVISTALGDSVSFTPALEALRAGLPHVPLVGLYHAAFAAMYREDPRLNAVIPYYGKYRRVAETVRALRQAGCDVALLAYMAEPDVVPLVGLGGCRWLLRMAGRDTVYRRMMANPEMLSPVQTAEHAVRRGLRTVEALGCPMTTERPRLPVREAARERVADRLGRRRVRPDALRVGLHPGASVENKRWPGASFVALGRRLLARDISIHLVLTGGPGERELVRRIVADLGSPERVTDVAGEVGIADLPALVASLDLLISADTGVAHVAYAVGTPSVTMFWRSDPAVSGPMHDLNRHVVVARQPLCPPCRTRTCEYPACAESITPDHVLEVALPLLDRRAVVKESR